MKTMVYGKNWKEISVFENIFDFYTNRFYLKTMKTDSIVLTVLPLRRKFPPRKKLVFSKKKRAIKLVYIKALIWLPYWV